MNLITIQKKFGTDRKCRLYLKKLRWGKTVTCTKCGSTNVVKLKKEVERYHCNNCKTTFSVLTDTIFEYSGLKLNKWFLIVGLMMNTKTGISAKEIQKNKNDKSFTKGISA